VHTMFAHNEKRHSPPREDVEHAISESVIKKYTAGLTKAPNIDPSFIVKREDGKQKKRRSVNYDLEQREQLAQKKKFQAKIDKERAKSSVATVDTEPKTKQNPKASSKNNPRTPQQDFLSSVSIRKVKPAQENSAPSLQKPTKTSVQKPAVKKAPSQQQRQQQQPKAARKKDTESVDDIDKQIANLQKKKQAMLKADQSKKSATPLPSQTSKNGTNKPHQNGQKTSATTKPKPQPKPTVTQTQPRSQSKPQSKSPPIALTGAKRKAVDTLAEAPNKKPRLSKEVDPEMAGFIVEDETPGPSYSSFIKTLGFSRGPTSVATYHALGGDDSTYDPDNPEIFDDDIDNMETNFADIAWEEARSARMAIKADKEEKRKLKEEENQLKRKKQGLTSQQKSLSTLPSVRKDTTPKRVQPTNNKPGLDSFF